MQFNSSFYYHDNLYTIAVSDNNDIKYLTLHRDDNGKEVEIYSRQDEEAREVLRFWRKGGVDVVMEYLHNNGFLKKISSEAT